MIAYPLTKILRKQLMRKIICAALVIATMSAFSAQAAETVFTWKAKAIDKKLGTPIEGVKFSWKFTDTIAGKISNDTCLTNAEGICEVKVTGDKSFFSGSNVQGEASFDKEGYEKIADTQWAPDDGVNKFVTIKMTNIALVKADAEEKEKKLALQREADAAEKADIHALRVLLLDTELKSGVTCATKAACDKLFALTEIYVSKSASMKIQMVTATTIETHNPIDRFDLGMSAYRMPGEGNSSMVTIKTICKDDSSGPSKLCLNRQLDVMKGYKPFVAALLKK